MPKYLFEGRYSVEGTKGVAREGGSGRRKALQKMFEGLGGKLESLHFAFGEVDAYVIGELPDNESAAAASLAVSQSGLPTSRVVVSGCRSETETPSDRARAPRLHVHHHDQTDHFWRAVEISERVTHRLKLPQPNTSQKIALTVPPRRPARARRRRGPADRRARRLRPAAGPRSGPSAYLVRNQSACEHHRIGRRIVMETRLVA